MASLRPLSRIRRRIAALLGLALLLAAAAITPVAAQVPDYGKLFGSPAAEPAAPTPLTAPGASGGRQSVPVAESGPAPSAADYGRVADDVADPMLGAAQKAVSLFHQRFVGMLNRIPGAFDEISATLAAASPTGRGIYFLGVALFAGLLLAAGQAVTAVVGHLVARPVFRRLEAGPADGYAGKFPMIVYRVLLTMVGLALTLAIAAAVGLFFYEEHHATQLTVVGIFATYAAVMLIGTVWRSALAPLLPRFRLPAISDGEALRLYRWLTYSSGFGVISSAFSYWVLGLGLPREVHVPVTVLLTLVTVVLFLTAIQVNRATITGMLMSGRPRAEASWLQRGGAALWAPLVSLYLIFTWGDLGFRLIMGIEAGPTRLAVPYLTLIAGLFVYAATIYLIERIFSRQRWMREINAEADSRRRAEAEAESGTGDSTAEIERGGDAGGAGAAVEAEAAPAGRRGSGMRTLEDLARRVASLFAMGAGIYALGMFWVGRGVFAGNAVFEATIDVLEVSFVGYVVFHAARIWLDRKIEDEGTDVELVPGGEGGGAGASRLATLLPLVRNFILIVILTTIALIVAMKLGANVAPLFAGAGIAGLAIGFGSQALVRDILSGVFFLMDDAFRKGEYIDVGTVKGTVEKISLRSFQLRHHLGMLHTIPFGEIQHVTNFSRDWVMMKLKFRLTYDTDIERVRKLIKKLGIELLEDPVVGDKFLQPLKSQGVIQMEDSAMIARVKFMTKPGDQWGVRKRVFTEIRALFEREGIAFASREVTVRLPDLPKGHELTENERRAVGAAARSTLDVVEAEQTRKTGTGGPADDR